MSQKIKMASRGHKVTSNYSAHVKKIGPVCGNSTYFSAQFVGLAQFMELAQFVGLAQFVSLTYMYILYISSFKTVYNAGASKD